MEKSNENSSVSRLGSLKLRRPVDDMTRKLILTILALAVVAGAQEVDAHIISGSESTVTHADIPKYPAVARTARLVGTVRLHVTVSRGTVVGVKVSSEANPMLISAATENVKTWQFRPTVLGSFDTTYSYELKGEEVSVETNPRLELQLPLSVRITAHPPKPMRMDCRAE
jgi:TonB family protein